MRYFIALLIMVGLIFSLVFLLFHGGSKPKSALTPLVNYATTDAEARFTLDGPVNANQNHQQVRISVNRDSVKFERISGYDNQVTQTQYFANSEAAYGVFLASLAHAGFRLGTNSAALNDERGYCPLGDRYIFEFVQGDHDLWRYWATSCGSPKTYGGGVSLTISLFQAQVPGYDNLTQDFTP